MVYTGFGIGLAIIAIGFSVVILIFVVITYFEYRRKRSRLNSLSSSAAVDHVQVVVKRDGLDAAAINAIPVFTYGTGCAVCLGEYKEGEEVRLMPECGHVFHRSCIDPWLMIHPTCPICRKTPPPATVANQ